MGSAVDPANLDRELARYHAAGIGRCGNHPHLRRQGLEDREIPYLSPKWMEMLDNAIATGSRLGMKTDMTTGTGWWFRRPHRQRQRSNAVIVSNTQQVQPGMTLTGTFNPPPRRPLSHFPLTANLLNLTSRIAQDGHVDWTADGGPWRCTPSRKSPAA